MMKHYPYIQLYWSINFFVFWDTINLVNTQKANFFNIYLFLLLFWVLNASYFSTVDDGPLTWHPQVDSPSRLDAGAWDPHKIFFRAAQLKGFAFLSVHREVNAVNHGRSSIPLKVLDSFSVDSNLSSRSSQKSVHFPVRRERRHLYTACGLWTLPFTRI